MDFAGRSENLNETIAIDTGSTAFDALTQVVGVEYQEYTGLGKYVTSINNVAGNEEYAWLYYVNGAAPNVGSDSYVLNYSDMVEYKYTLLEEAFGEME